MVTVGNGRGNNETARLIRTKPQHDPSFHFPVSSTSKLEKIFLILESYLENVGEDDLPVLAGEQRRPGGELRRVGEVEDEDVERLKVERLVN